MTSAPSRWRRIAASTAVLMPPLVIVWLIHALGVNIPFEDDWDTLIVLKNWDDGRLAFAHFWQQHNEHRVPVLRALFWLLGLAADGDMVVDMSAGFAFVTLTLVIVRRLLKTSLEADHSLLIVPMTVVSSFLLFSLVFEEVWFSATASIELCPINFATVGLVWALTRPASPGRFAVALASALMGMLSGASGIALWATGAVAIWLTNRGDGRLNRALMLWLFGAAASFLIYGWGLHWGGSSVLTAFAHPVLFVRFMLSCLGLPFALGSSPGASAFAGGAACCGLAVAAIQIRRSEPDTSRALRPFALLACHGLVVTALIALGRWQLPPRFAMASHYAFGPSLFWIGTIVMAAVATRTLPPEEVRFWNVARTAGIAITSALLVLAYARANVEGFDHAYVRSQNLRVALASVTTDEPITQDVVRFLYPPDGDRIRDQIRWLRDRRLGPFAPRRGSQEVFAAATTGGHPVSEAADGFHDGGDCDRTIGWAWDPAQPNAPVMVDVWRGGTRLGTVRAGWFRRDLADAGIGNGRHGFIFFFPSAIELGTGQRITATVAGSQTRLRGSPRIVTCQVD